MKYFVLKISYELSYQMHETFDVTEAAHELVAMESYINQHPGCLKANIVGRGYNSKEEAEEQCKRFLEVNSILLGDPSVINSRSKYLKIIEERLKYARKNKCK